LFDQKIKDAFFDYDKADISEDAREALSKDAEFLDFEDESNAQPGLYYRDLRSGFVFNRILIPESKSPLKGAATSAGAKAYRPRVTAKSAHHSAPSTQGVL